MQFRTAFMMVLACVLFFHCNSGSSLKQNSNNAFNHQNNLNNVVCLDGQLRCAGNILQICTENDWSDQHVCGVGQHFHLPKCDPVNQRCQKCISNQITCGTDNNLRTCTDGGSVGPVVTECDANSGELCVEDNGTAYCDHACDGISGQGNNRGCEYWAVGMSNSLLSSTFNGNFALAVDNNNDAPARVRIQGGGANVDEMVPARTHHVFMLNYVMAHKNPSDGGGLQSGFYRAAENQGGFHVRTSLPVTVYQFNPYDYVIDGDNSYTNDASLLLPVHSLSQNYLVMSRPTWIWDSTNSPGVAVIVASQDNTSVLVQTRANVAGGPGVPQLAPGGSSSFAMNKGDVLQLVTRNDLSYNNCPTGPGAERISSGGDGFCNPGHAYDLTGTMITATAPIAVWGGHNCTFIPYHYWACDHIEEMLFPLETWGKRFMVGLTRQVNPGSTETNVIRILASENNTHITFNPPSVANPTVLNMGEFLEFMPQPNTHFEVQATGPIMIGKFTVGQDYSGNSAGDPAFGLVVPVEQYGSEYNFTAPPSMTKNFVNVISLLPANPMEYIQLNGTPITISDYTPIGTTGYGVAQKDVTNAGTNGSNRIVAPNPSIKFGIEVYGFASYTSYMYPGGLNLEFINPIGN